MNNKLSNSFIVPNEIFSLGLTSDEIATYAYLRKHENRKTYQVVRSYEEIGNAIQRSKNSVKKYIFGLIEKRLITAIAPALWT